MRDGSFNGDKMTNKDIQNLKLSKNWKSQCDKHLRKEIYQKNTAINKLTDFVEKWKDNVDPIKKTPLFSKHTVKT